MKESGFDRGVDGFPVEAASTNRLQVVFREELVV
jgi:hypothetical protein